MFAHIATFAFLAISCQLLSINSAQQQSSFNTTFNDTTTIPSTTTTTATTTSQASTQLNTADHNNQSAFNTTVAHDIIAATATTQTATTTTTTTRTTTTSDGHDDNNSNNSSLSTTQLKTDEPPNTTTATTTSIHSTAVASTSHDNNDDNAYANFSYTTTVSADNDHDNNNVTITTTTTTSTTVAQFQTDDDSNETTTSYWDDCDLDWKLDFVGRSGKFKLYPCGNDNYFIQVSLKSIQEWNNGQTKKSKNKVKSFSFKNSKSNSQGSGQTSIYQWKDVNGNDVNLTGVTLDYLFNVNGNDVIFQSTLYLIDQIIEINWNNNTQMLQKGSLKFDYYMENWPFDDADSELEIVLRMTTGGTQSSHKKSKDDNENDVKGYAWGNDEFAVSLPESYDHVDSQIVTTSKHVKITFETTDDDSTDVDVSFVFEQAGNAHIISYDPWIQNEASNNTDDNNINSSYSTTVVDTSNTTNATVTASSTIATSETVTTIATTTTTTTANAVNNTNTTQESSTTTVVDDNNTTTTETVTTATTTTASTTGIESQTSTFVIDDTTTTTTPQTTNDENTDSDSDSSITTTVMANNTAETDDDINETTSYWDDCGLDWKVDFVGRSGKFKLYPCGNDDYFIQVSLKSIQEWNNGQTKKSKNKVNSFSFKNSKSKSQGSGQTSIYQWKDIYGNDVNLTGITLNYLFNVNGNDVIFESTLYLIDQTIAINWNNNSQTLEKGSLKFDYYMENWPFDDADSELEIVLKVTTGGTESSDKTSQDDSENGVKGYAWGNNEFAVSLPENYDHIDNQGISTSKDVKITFEATQDSTDVDVSFVFEQVGNARIISYDPWIQNAASNLNNSDNGGNTYNNESTTTMSATDATISTTVAIATTTVNGSNETTTSYWDDCDLDWKVDFVGPSGKFKLCPCSNDNYFIQVSLKSIQEWNNGQTKKSKNKVKSFSFKNSKSKSQGSGQTSIYQWKDVNGNDVNLTGVTLDYLFNVNGNDVIFQSTLYLIDQTIEINWNNNTQILQKGSLKFDYYMENWPFDDADSELEIVLRMTTGGTQSSDKKSHDDTENGVKGYAWGNGEFAVSLPENYDHIDGQTVSTSKNVKITFETTDGATDVDVSFVFEHAGDAHVISYDPWIQNSISNSSDTWDGGDSCAPYQFGISKHLLCFMLIYIIPIVLN